MLPLQQFTDYITQQQLFQPNDRILLAVSGGKDSVLMVQLFKLAGYQFGIAHCNFNLRGTEAQRDETFVKLLAEELEVPFHIAHFDTKAFAQQHKISIQMAARQLRYEWFDQLAANNSYTAIALAHHQNDAVETVLLNLVRGTGIGGMHGILPKRDQLIRPLLFLSRQEIDRLIASHHIPYVEDSSNTSSKYARNKIRLEVVPHLREINPNLEETFVQNMHRFAQTETLLQQVVAQTKATLFRQQGRNVYLQIEAIQQLQPQALLMFELLKPFHFTASVVNEILQSLHKQSGTSFYSHSHSATLNRGALVISPKEQIINELYYLHGEGAQKLAYGNAISFTLENDVRFETAKMKAFADANLLVFPLVIRYKQNGDSFKPLGMKGFKKLSDFFVDEKVPLTEKNKIPLVINGNGEIIWVAGMRQDERYKVTSRTKKVAIFELLNL